MQLLHIRIPDFRNLRDLDIAFDTHLPPATGAVPRGAVGSGFAAHPAA